MCYADGTLSTEKLFLFIYILVGDEREFILWVFDPDCLVVLVHSQRPIIFILDFQRMKQQGETKSIMFFTRPFIYFYKNNLGQIKRMFATHKIMPAKVHYDIPIGSTKCSTNVPALK